MDENDILTEYILMYFNEAVEAINDGEWDNSDLGLESMTANSIGFARYLLAVRFYELMLAIVEALPRPLRRFVTRILD